MNSMKKQKGMTLEDEIPRLIGAQYATGKSGEITPERMKWRGLSGTMLICGGDWR